MKSRLRLVFNLFTVWLLTGIWHGANWTFILWGVLYGVLIVLEKLLDLPAKVKCSAATSIVWRLVTLLAVMLGWVLFRSDSLSSAGQYISTMFVAGATSLADITGLSYLREYLVTIVIGVACATPIFRIIREKVSSIPKAGPVLITAGYVMHLVLFLMSVSALIMNAHNPFIYFNF